MKERPILFSGAMVRAILEGKKTQTRRVVKPDQWYVLNEKTGRGDVFKGKDGTIYSSARPWWNIGGIYGEVENCPYGQPGDRLWVRETFCHKFNDNEMFVYNAEGNLDQTCCYYRADGLDVDFPEGGGWTPSIYMPRWASRITLEITGVRVERLQEISEEDARAEGCKESFWPSERLQFAGLWDSINSGRGYPWAANPWVWVVEFKQVD